ncbi:unnamed protein product, partial [Musa acuminata var. zebrina]
MLRSFALLPSSRTSQKSRVRRVNLRKSHQLFSVLERNKTSASTVGFLVHVAGTMDFFPVIPPSPPLPIYKHVTSNSIALCSCLCLSLSLSLCIYIKHLWASGRQKKQSCGCGACSVVSSIFFVFSRT